MFYNNLSAACHPSPQPIRFGEDPAPPLPRSRMNQLGQVPRRPARFPISCKGTDPRVRPEVQCEAPTSWWALRLRNHRAVSPHS